MEEDLALVQRVKTGDRRAFKKLYDGHVERLFRFMRQFSSDRMLVEDWVQRAFIKAYNNIASFQGRARFATWLYTIALNEMRTDLRRPALTLLTIADLHDSPSSGQEEVDFQWNDAMRASLGGLDEAKRTVFLLYEVEGYSHAEIATMLDISEGNSRILLARAKHHLRITLESLENAI